MLLVMLVAPVTTVVAEPGGGAGNYLDLLIQRSSFLGGPEGLFLDMELTLEGVPGVTGVTITTGNGFIVPMSDDGGGVWIVEGNPTSLAELITRSNGTWTVEIFGASPSISTFTVNTASLVDGDLFPVPTGLSPAQGATGVSPDAILSWSDPTGGATADVISVCYFNLVDFTFVCDDSIFGSMLVTDTSWIPPAPLTPGLTAFEVSYLDFDASRIGPMNVTSGAIVWSDHPYAPVGYPAATPLILLGSETGIEFTVASGPTDNFVNLVMLRTDDFASPGADFIMDMDVNLSGVSGVTGVNITTGDGTILAMSDDGGGAWSVDHDFALLSDLITNAHGTWTVDVLGSSPSTSTFAVNAAILLDGDFYATPTGLIPAHGATGVTSGTVMSWTDPTGGATADAISVCYFNLFDFTDVCENSVFNSILVTDTSWSPPAPMTPGLTEFDIAYVDFPDTLIGPLNVTAGLITWSDSPLAPVGYPASTPLHIIGSDTLIAFTVVPDQSAYVELGMFRSDDALVPSNFKLEMFADLENIPGVSGGNITIGDGTIVPMVLLDNASEWGFRMSIASVAEMITRSNGTWTVDIFGSSPSTSTFSVNSTGLLDSDFFASPTGLFPANGAVDVSADVIMSWNDPTGPATPDGIGVCFENLDVFGGVCDDSVLGTMTIADTSWIPPAPLNPGLTEFGVVYVDIDDTRVGPLNLTSGLITWTDHPFTPLGYPASTPLHFLGSTTIITFTVLNACPADTDSSGAVNVTDLLSLLAGWGPNPGHVADINGDGNVNVTDLLALLAAWGACP